MAEKEAEKPLLEVQPSWWYFFWYLVFGWLIVPVIVALWKKAGLVLKIYADKVVLERGVLSKHITQVLISDIRSLDTKQNLMQRAVNIGDVMIATAGISGYEMIAQGLPDPRGIVNLILKQRQKNKETNN